MTPANAFPAAAHPPPGWARTFAGIWRLTWPRHVAPRRLLGTAATLVGIGAILSLSVRTGSAGQFYAWANDIYLTFLIPIIAFLAGAEAMREHLGATSVDYVLTRPVRRPVLLVSSFLSQFVCVQLTCLLTFAVLGIVGELRQIEGLATALPPLLLAQVLAATAFLALGYVCGALTSRYLVLGIAYVGIIEAGLGNVQMQLNRLSMLHHAKAVLPEVFPRLHADAAATQGPGASLLFVAAFVLVLGGLTAVVFIRREFTGQKARES